MTSVDMFLARPRNALLFAAIAELTDRVAALEGGAT